MFGAPHSKRGGGKKRASLLKRGVETHEGGVKKRPCRRNVWGPLRHTGKKGARFLREHAAREILRRVARRREGSCVRRKNTRRVPQAPWGGLLKPSRGRREEIRVFSQKIRALFVATKGGVSL